MSSNFVTLTFFALTAFYVPLSLGALELPPGALQQKIFLALRNEMVRLDGEGLLSRKNRPESFSATTDALAELADLGEKNSIKARSYNSFLYGEYDSQKYWDFVRSLRVAIYK